MLNLTVESASKHVYSVGSPVVEKFLDEVSSRGDLVSGEIEHLFWCSACLVNIELSLVCCGRDTISKTFLPLAITFLSCHPCG